MVAASMLGGIISIGTYTTFIQDDVQGQKIENDKPVAFTKYETTTARPEYSVPDGLNFVSAAEKTTPTVVHIKTYADASAMRRNTPRFFHDFFNDPRSEGGQLGSGSGVIISGDGFIATKQSRS